MYRPLAVLTTASDIEVLARFGRAPADPIRCRILPSPRDAPACPADLADALGVSRTRLSNHLACLRDCGLVDYRVEGRQSFYALTRPELSDLLRSAELLLAATGAAVALCPTYGAEEETR